MTEMTNVEGCQAGKSLVLIDSMALIYRAHFALIRSPRYTRAGKCTSAIFGFCNTVFGLLNRQFPTHIAAAFDTPEPTHRHEVYEDYKANRQEMPEDLAEQIPDIVRLLEAMHVRILRYPGWEADDVIGTLARRADLVPFTTYLVTPDKDYHQLVTHHTSIWKPGRKGAEYELLGVSEVLERWKIERVSQVIDMLGLMGDSSDNIPGVPGIGEKTAQKLIQEFGSVEELLARTDELKGKRRENIESYADQARLSKELVTISTDVPVDLDWSEFASRSWDEEALVELFHEWEFNMLGKRMFGDKYEQYSPSVSSGQSQASGQATLFDEPQEKTLADVSHQYHILQTQAERSSLIEKLQLQSAFCFDLETTQLDARHARPLGIAISFQPNEAYYVVVPDDEDDASDVLYEFAGLFANPKIEKIGHNLKYDLTVLRWHGLRVENTVDTMLLHAQIEPEMRHGMDHLAEHYLGYTPISIKSLIGDEKQGTMADVPLPQLAEYACEDADITLQLCLQFRPIVDERDVAQVCYQVECPLTPVLVDMEYEGIRIDTDALRNYSDRLGEEIAALRDRIFAASGHEFNIDSPKQLGVVLYEELKIEEQPKRTATGQYSTREAELTRLVGRHSVVRDVLDYRNATKLKSVYVDQLPQAVEQRTGRIHTNYSQSWTATGRMQSNNPNLQTIPVRKERGREIRAAFVPRGQDYEILAADYSQIELRIMAAFSQDPEMLNAFETGTDIHSVTASKVYKVELDDVTRAMRDVAKMVNFGIIYGISAYGLQQRLNIPRAEAAELINNYFEKYPKVKEYMDGAVTFARENGFVKTVTGRRRYLRDINSRNYSLRSAAERLAMNSPIQGTAADLLKIAMVKVHRLLREGGYQTKMLLTVHDELVFDLYRPEAESLMPLIQQAMENALCLGVPIVVEMGTGDNWLAAH